jgi:hypothetical protein
MNKEQEIKRILTKRGFSKMRNRDTWTKGSWTVRFYENDIEVFDSITESGRYLVDTVTRINIESVLDDIII